MRHSAWFAAARSTELFGSSRIWAIAGESIFFDSVGKDLPPDYPAKAKNFAIATELGTKFMPLNFVPSTCFATTADKWKAFGASRGSTRR